jgi:hypothetical protein
MIYRSRLPDAEIADRPWHRHELRNGPTLTISQSARRPTKPVSGVRWLSIYSNPPLTIGSCASR